MFTFQFVSFSHSVLFLTALMDWITKRWENFLKVLHNPELGLALMNLTESNWKQVVFAFLLLYIAMF